MIEDLGEFLSKCGDEIIRVMETYVKDGRVYCDLTTLQDSIAYTTSVLYTVAKATQDEVLASKVHGLMTASLLMKSIIDSTLVREETKSLPDDAAGLDEKP